MAKFKFDREKIPLEIEGNTEYTKFIRGFNRCVRLLENNSNLSAAEYEGISQLLTAMQKEMKPYNPQNPIPQAGKESLNLINSLVNEMRDLNQINKAVSAVAPYISPQESTPFPSREPQQEEGNLSKGLVGALKGVAGIAVTALGAGLAFISLFTPGDGLMKVSFELMGAGVEIAAKGAKET